MAELIDGKRFAEDILAQVKNESESFKNKRGKAPGLAVIIAGEDPASMIYVASKARKAEQCGFYSETIRLEANVSQALMAETVRKLNRNDKIHGILVQLPLPEHIDAAAVLQAIDPKKDVDGLHYENAGKLASGDKSGFTPCTPLGIMYMLRRIHGKDLSGLDAVVVGRSNIVGKPVAALLLAANATITVAHTKTRELAEVVRSADILIAACGQAELIKGSWIKPGATVIDVGVNRVPPRKQDNKKSALIGDVEHDAAAIIAGHISPVPGGVGPMTIAMLMANTLRAACLAMGDKAPEWD